MSDWIARLRMAAKEMRESDEPGWPNTCEWAADEIERLSCEVSDRRKAMFDCDGDCDAIYIDRRAAVSEGHE